MQVLKPNLLVSLPNKQKKKFKPKIQYLNLFL